MTRDQIRAKLADIIRQATPYKGEITDKTRLVEDIGADSLQLIGIVTAVEAAFGIAIPDEALMDMKCVGDAVDRVAASLTS